MTAPRPTPSTPRARFDPGAFDAVVFDMDGVITDTATVHARAWTAVFDAYLHDHAHDDAARPFTDADYRRYVDGRQRQDGVVSFLASRGIDVPLGEPGDPPDRETAWGIANRKDAEFHRVVGEQGVHAFPTSVALVRALQTARVGTAIVSASRNAQMILDAAGIGDLFPVRVDGNDAQALHLPGKPDPALFVEAATRLGVMRSRAVVVEDALAGVEAGRRGGFGLVIGVDRHGAARALARAGADVVVPDLGALPLPAASGPALDGQVAPGWALVIEGHDPDLERLHAALLTLAGGRVGLRRSAFADGGPARWAAVLGVYDGEGADTQLLAAPAPAGPWSVDEHANLRHALDLRDGVLHETLGDGDARSATTFVSLAAPGVVAMRVAGAGATDASVRIEPAAGHGEGAGGATRWTSATATPIGGVVTALRDATTESRATVRDWVAAYIGDPEREPDPDDAVRVADAAAREGFDTLHLQQRRAWAARWDDADIRVEGDDRLQAALRFTLFHLMAAVPDTGEAAVGARGATGSGYRGHVFWDADTFVLPFLAATHPAAARAMLEYRVRRLPAALDTARRMGRRGARYPWESARTGYDVTPTSALTRAGETLEIRTGEQEEHIVADVAWGAACYADWTGDDEFLRGDGLRVLVETARYWASRVRIDDAGAAHIDGVIGPDEYHDDVDDNAYTNVMARWNLRRAATAVEAARDHADASPDVSEDELREWRSIADQIVDGYDPNTGVYEQFTGFDALEPLVIADVAPRRPIAADLLIGHDRIARTQVVKQADVLMLHHLVPGEVQPGSLDANLRYYEPRTAHGSSLSPAIHASLFARARDFEHALPLLDTAARIDLDDLTGTTAAGLHLATMGGLWQAFAYGFFGFRPDGVRLTMDPRLPPSWDALEMRVRYRGSRVIARLEARRLVVRADPAVDVVLGGRAYTADPFGVTLERVGERWRRAR